MKKKIITLLRYLICKISGKSQHYWDMERVCHNYGYSTSSTKKPSDIKMSVPEGMEYNVAYSLDDLIKHKKIVKARVAKTKAKKKIDYSENKVPNYYIGQTYGYEAAKVCEDFELSYNVGTSVTYLLRCGKKYEEGMKDLDKHIEDVIKAKNHLGFELTRLNNIKKRNKND